MPLSLFGISANPFDELVERATTEKQTTENWGLILEICDQISQGDAQAASDCALSLRKRLNHRDPHVVMLALCVIDSCVSNCGRKFKSEVCSKEFIGELHAKATGSNRLVAERTRLLIRRWCQESAHDNSMEPVQTLYTELKKEGYEFPDTKEKKKGSSGFDVIAFKQEEEDLAKAIQLSLKDQQGPASQVPVQRLNTIHSDSTPKTAVKALYDFEAVEDNELSFLAGEYITLTDDSDPNWWIGSNHRGEGLFPASFVTRDLSVSVERQENKKSVCFDENVLVTSMQPEKATEIDEAKLDKCLAMLQEADPTGERPDPPELLQLERKSVHRSFVVFCKMLSLLNLGECHAVTDLIDKELYEIDQQHNRLAESNVRLMDAMNLYDFAMNESSMPMTLMGSQGQYASNIGPARHDMTPPAHYAAAENVGIPAQQTYPASGAQDSSMPMVPM